MVYLSANIIIFSLHYNFIRLFLQKVVTISKIFRNIDHYFDWKMSIKRRPTMKI